MALSTNDCRNFLISNPDVQQMVRDRAGWTDALSGASPWTDVEMKWVQDALNPAKWKRQMKFKVGSKNAPMMLDYTDPSLAQLSASTTASLRRRTTRCACSGWTVLTASSLRSWSTTASCIWPRISATSGYQEQATQNRKRSNDHAQRQRNPR